MNSRVKTTRIARTSSIWRYDSKTRLHLFTFARPCGTRMKLKWFRCWNLFSSTYLGGWLVIVSINYLSISISIYLSAVPSFFFTLLNCSSKTYGAKCNQLFLIFEGNLLNLSSNICPWSTSCHLTSVSFVAWLRMHHLKFLYLRISVLRLTGAIAMTWHNTEWLNCRGKTVFYMKSRQVITWNTRTLTEIGL